MSFDTLVQTDQHWLLALNGSHSAYLDALAKVLTNAGTWIPLYAALLYVVLKNSDNVRRVVLVIACAVLCVLLAGTIDDTIVKPLVARWRPTRDPDIGYLVDIVNGYRGGRFGFFSAHASNTFSIAVFFSLLIRDRVLSVSMVIWSLINCWTRVYLGVHYPGDILCGLLWGGVVGTGVWFLYSKVVPHFSSSVSYVSNHYTKTGFLRSHSDIVTSVFILTILYAIIRACFTLYI